MAADDRDPEPDRETLAERIAELEATVESQQQTIRKMLPNRREFLRAGGVAVAGAGIGAAAVGGAAADASVDDDYPDVGTPDRRVDVFGDGVGANTVDTDEINDGGPLSDGDGTERQIWVIANDASDPSDASDDDIIFEEE
ncbi:MAG: hypothetical protein ACLFR6_08235 [Salinarchaeum sp.]